MLHRTVLIIFPRILQTIVIAQMLSNEHETELKHTATKMNPKTQATKPSKTELTPV